MSVKRNDVGNVQLQEEFNTVVTETEQLLKSLNVVLSADQ